MTTTPGQSFSLPTLAAMVVGSMVGAGIFSLPQTFGRATGGLGALIAWAIAGGGMLMLALVFQTLSRRRPDLDAGVFAYAKAGFGDYPGFLSALGYWTVGCLGNVSYWVLIKSTLGAVFPVFGDGNTVAAVAVSSVGIWAFHFTILRGVRQAAMLNTLVTIAKIIPILIFLVVVGFAFDPQVFGDNFLGGAAAGQDVIAVTAGAGDVGIAAEVAGAGRDLAALAVTEPAWEDPGTGAAQTAAPGDVASGAAAVPSLFEQVRGTMLVTVFVFVGIEGASVYSRYARRREDVGVATVLGFLGVLTLLVLVTMVAYGVLPRAELAQLRNPSMAGVLQAVVGRWGAVFVGAGLVVSVLGAYLSWSLLAAEVLFSAARMESMPRFLARQNPAGVPAAALWLTNGLVQLFLVLTLFSQEAFLLALKLTSSMILLPYLLVGAYAWKLAHADRRDGSAGGGASRGGGRAGGGELVRAVLATAYAAFLVYAGGIAFLLLSLVLYVPGTVLYVLARRERGRRIFTPLEAALFAAAVLGALAAVYGLATGRIVV